MTLMQARPLNVFQRLIRTWEAVHPYNAAQAIRVLGSADAEQVNRAWWATLGSMGLGRVRVGRETFVHESVNGDAARNPVRILAPGSAHADHLSGALNVAFDASAVLPFRPYLLQEGDGFYFGVVYQHWVADSVSIRQLLRRWCEHYFRDDPPAPAPAVGRGGYWSMFGPRRDDCRPGQIALDLFRSHMRFRRARKVRTSGAQDYPVGVALRELPDATADALRTRARAIGATVGDVLLAALAEAADAHVPFQRRRNRPDLAVGNIVDLRPFAGDAAGPDHFDLLLGFAHVFCRPADLRDFDRLVRAVTAQTIAARRRGGIAPASAAWMSAALAVQRLVPSHRLYGFYRKEVPLAAGLSNVQLRGSWAESMHPTPLSRYLRVSPTGPMAPVVLSVTTLGRRMDLALTYRCSVLEGDRAQAMLIAIGDRLAAFARGT